MELQKSIIDDLVSIIITLFDNEIEKDYLYSLMSNFKEIIIIENDIKNVGSYTIDGKIYISQNNLKRIDYLLHELFHVILHNKIEYGLEEALCEYVATIYRNMKSSEYESYAYYAQVNLLEQIDYIYKSTENHSIVIDILKNLENYKKILIKVYKSIEKVDELLLSLNKLTDHDYYMTWNNVSLDEENKIYEEHDRIYEHMTKLNQEYSLDSNNDVFKKYI